MPQLNATISSGLWQALLDYAERTQEPLAHIASKALAEYLQVPHHTLYQVSTATALVEGIYQGAVRVGALREHGDLGLGTFENLDGEMVIVDGHFFQVRSDGSVRECGDEVLSPFAVITPFAPDAAVTLDQMSFIWTPILSQIAQRYTAACPAGAISEEMELDAAAIASAAPTGAHQADLRLDRSSSRHPSHPQMAQPQHGQLHGRSNKGGMGCGRHRPARG